MNHKVQRFVVLATLIGFVATTLVATLAAK